MATSSSNQEIDTRYYRVLSNAWKRFNEYDLHATKLKKNYVQPRQIIISLGLITTALAVIAFFPIMKTIVIPGTQVTFENVLRVTLFVLPLISVWLLESTRGSEPSSTWVNLRIAAENIKQAIYSLRTKQGLNLATPQDYSALATVVSSESKRLGEQGVALPINAQDNQNRLSMDERVKPAYVDVPDKDDGYKPLTFSDYLEVRLYPQSTWYSSRATVDRKSANRSRLLVIFLSGVINPILVFVGGAIWIAVTGALITSILAWTSLQQYGRNYSLYSKTSRHIADLGDKLSVELDTTNAAQIMQTVESVENAFQQEREQWKQNVIQGQQVAEDEIKKNAESQKDIQAKFAALAKQIDSPTVDEEQDTDGTAESH